MIIDSLVLAIKNQELFIIDLYHVQLILMGMGFLNVMVALAHFWRHINRIKSFL